MKPAFTPSRTYSVASGNAPGVTLGNLRICNSTVINAVEVPMNQVNQSVGSTQIVTKYFSGQLIDNGTPSATFTTNVISFNLTFVAAVTVRDTALFQGNALTMKFLQQPSDFAQFVKNVDGVWKIRVGVNENDFVELTTVNSLTTHANKYSNIHMKPGVSGDVVGTIGNQTLENKTIKNATFSQTAELAGNMFLKEYPVADLIDHKQVFSAKVVYDKIKTITMNGSVADHNKRVSINDNSGEEAELHGLGLNDGKIVGESAEQTLTRKTISVGEPADNFIGDVKLLGINKPIASTANQVPGELPTNKSIVDYMNPLSEPIFMNISRRGVLSGEGNPDTLVFGDNLRTSSSNITIETSQLGCTLSGYNFDNNTLTAVANPTHPYLFVKVSKKAVYSIKYEATSYSGVETVNSDPAIWIMTGTTKTQVYGVTHEPVSGSYFIAPCNAPGNSGRIAFNLTLATSYSFYHDGNGDKYIVFGAKLIDAVGDRCQYNISIVGTPLL